MADETAQLPPTGVDRQRLASFSDNVISIALTLLVLDVRLPDHWGDLTLLGILRPLRPRLLSFVLSFAIIGVYWVGHHMVLYRFRSATRGMLWVNNLFLLLISLVPASAALTGSYPGQSAAEVLYGANVAGVAAAMLLLQWTGDRHHRAIGHPLPTDVTRRGYGRSLSGMAIAAGGMGVAVVAPHVSYAVYWLTPIAYLVLQSKPQPEVAQG